MGEQGSQIQLTEVRPDVFAVEYEATADGQTARTRYEAPTLEALGQLVLRFEGPDRLHSLPPG